MCWDRSFFEFRMQRRMKCSARISAFDFRDFSEIRSSDWMNAMWIPQASNQSPKSKKPQSRVQSGGGGKKSSETAKKNKKQQEACEEEEAGGGSSTSNSSPKKTATASGQAKKSSPVPLSAKPESPACVKRAKTARDNNRDLGLCRYRMPSAWNNK